jgi:hypothetical protein
MLVKDSKTLIFMKKGHQHNAQQEEENKIQGFSIKSMSSPSENT